MINSNGNKLSWKQSLGRSVTQRRLVAEVAIMLEVIRSTTGCEKSMLCLEMKLEGGILEKERPI